MHQQFFWKNYKHQKQLHQHTHSNGKENWTKQQDGVYVCVYREIIVGTRSEDARIYKCVYEERQRCNTGENELRKRNEYKKMSERKSRAQKSESTNRKKCWRYMHWIEYLKRCNKSTHSRQHELYIYIFFGGGIKNNTHTHRVRENGAEHIASMKWMQKRGGREKEKWKIKRKREKNMCQQDEHAQHF